MVEKEKQVEAFKTACAEYLHTRGLESLRCYGRYVGLVKPTGMNKLPLIQEIISVLCGETAPCRTRRGAPVKNNFVDEKFLRTIAQLRQKYLDETDFFIYPEPDQEPLKGSTVLVKDGSGKTVATVTSEVAVQVVVIAPTQGYSVTKEE